MVCGQTPFGVSELCWKRHGFPCLRRRQPDRDISDSVWPVFGVQRTVFFEAVFLYCTKFILIEVNKKEKQ